MQSLSVKLLSSCSMLESGVHRAGRLEEKTHVKWGKEQSGVQNPELKLIR